LFGDPSDPKNANIELIEIDMNHEGFFNKFFCTHFYMVHTAFYLAKLQNVEGRDLISIAAKHPWWSNTSIDKHPSCVNIPNELEKEIKEAIVI